MDDNSMTLAVVILPPKSVIRYNRPLQWLYIKWITCCIKGTPYQGQLKRKQCNIEKMM